MSSSIELSFYNLVREAVHSKWDPIGISDFSDEMGEYDTYLPGLCQLLSSGASERVIFNFLWHAEVEAMGLSGDKKATKVFCRWLIENTSGHPYVVKLDTHKL